MSKRNSRRSSILKKSPSRNVLEDLDNNVDPTELTQFDNVTATHTKYSKRVSFADTNQIKEIIRVADIAKDWHDSSASDNSLSKLHDASSLTTPMIKKSQQPSVASNKGPKDLQSLLKGPLTEQRVNYDMLETSAMDMTNVSEVGFKASESTKENVAPQNIPTKSPFTPGFNFFDNSNLGFGQNSPLSSKAAVEDKENIRAESRTTTLYTKDFLKSLQLIETKTEIKSKTSVEVPMRPHVNPPSYKQCLAGVAGRRSILATPLETSEEKKFTPLQAQAENISPEQNEPMDHTVIFDKSIGEELDITCTTQVVPNANRVPSSDISNPELTDLENVQSEQIHPISSSDTDCADEGMDFTCTNPALGNFMPEVSQDDVFVSDDRQRACSSTSADDAMDFTRTAPITGAKKYSISNEDDRTKIFNVGDESMMEFTSVTGLIAENKTSGMQQNEKNHNIQNLVQTENMTKLDADLSSEEMDITKALHIPLSSKDTDPVIETGECKSTNGQILQNINVVDNCLKSDLNYSSDEMDITKALHVPVLMHPSANSAEKGHDVNSASESVDNDIFVPDTQPTVDENAHDAISPTENVVNETVNITQHFTNGDNDMDFTEAIESQQQPAQNEDDFLIPDTQMENTQKEIDDTLNELEGNSENGAGMSQQIVESSGGESEEICEDTLDTSAFKRKMARVRNSIGLYKARQEREHLMRDSSSDAESAKNSDSEMPEPIVGANLETAKSESLKTDQVATPVPEVLFPEIIENDAESWLTGTSKSEIPKIAVKRPTESSTSKETFVSDGLFISSQGDFMTDSGVAAKISKICNEDTTRVTDGGINQHLLGVTNIPFGANTSHLVQDSLQIKLATVLDKSILEDTNKKQLQKKDQNITVDEFLEDYAHIKIKNLKKSRQSIVVPASATQQPTGLKEMFKAVKWTSKEVSINDCFVEKMKKKIEWLEEDIGKIEQELSGNNPQIFKTIRDEGEESEELCDKLQKLSSCCKSLGKAYWKRDACKLYKGLHQSAKIYLEEELTPTTSKLGSPQDLIDSALKEMEEANKQLDEMIKSYEDKEKPPTELQANLYRENQEKAGKLEKKHEEIMNLKLSSAKEETDIRERRQKMMNIMLYGNEDENKRRKIHKEVTESLKMWEKYSQWKLTMLSEKKLHFSFLSDSLSLMVEFENEISEFRNEKKIVSYTMETNTSPDNVISSEVENFKMYHKFIRSIINSSCLKEDYPDFASLKLLLRRISILSAAIEELIDDIDWISCRFAHCQCSISSEDNSCTIRFLPPMIGVDGFQIKFFLSAPDSSESDDLILSVLKHGFQIISHDFIPGRRQLEHIGKTEIACVLSTVLPGRQHLKRSVEAVLKAINISD